MEQKSFLLNNRGMNRDITISKAGESAAFENHNVRITARDHDTLLSITNERGNKKITSVTILGELIGWNVLNNHIILFTHNSEQNTESEDSLSKRERLKEQFEQAHEFVVSSINTLRGIQEFGSVNLLNYKSLNLIRSVLEETYNPLMQEYYSEFSSLFPAILTNLLKAMDELSWFLSKPQEVMPVSTAIGFKETEIYLTEIEAVTHTAYNEYSMLYGPDKIYRIDYIKGQFNMPDSRPLYSGVLNFSCDNPIESVVYFETEDIQKVYWVDGKNVLRYMNIMAKDDVRASWDDTSFDSNRMANFDVKFDGITKDNSGETRPNGVAQYLLTYYNKYGHETGYVWISDLVYLSPFGVGGSADGKNTNSVTLSFSNADSRFSHYRLYSIFRSALNGTSTAYLVSEGAIADGVIKATDNGSHLTLVDFDELLFLGSKSVTAGTLTHKDQTLFLGDLISTGRGSSYTDLETAIRENMFEENGWESNCIEFVHSLDTDGEVSSIPYPDNSSVYPYENQLQYTSSEITTFKGGEKYRFALKFQTSDGSDTEAFWIGDKENTLYPSIENGSINRVVARCNLPSAVVSQMHASGFKTVQLCIAEATYADRSVKAQGIVNPTMFNVWERYNNRSYAIPSWVTRPRNSNVASMHLESVHNSSMSSGEIQCNYWESTTPRPYYTYDHFLTPERQFSVDYRMDSYVASMITFKLRRNSEQFHWYTGSFSAYILKGYTSTDEGKELLLTHYFTQNDIDRLFQNFGNKVSFENGAYSLSLHGCGGDSTSLNWGKAIEELHSEYLQGLMDCGIEDPAQQLVNAWPAFERMFGGLNDNRDEAYKVSGWGGGVSSTTYYFVSFNQKLGTEWDDRFSIAEENFVDLFNAGATSGPASKERWYDTAIDNSIISLTGQRLPAFSTKQYMFVDENVVTLNSPELQYNAVDVDNAGYKFRIVGIAPVTSGLSDYSVDASHGNLPGTNLMDYSIYFSGNMARKNLLSWPLWREYGLTSDGTDWDSNTKYYWLHMWHRIGSISGLPGTEYSELKRKIFANLTFANKTLYLGSMPVYDTTANGSIRMSGGDIAGYSMLNIGNETKYYSGEPQIVLTCPFGFKYPIFFEEQAATGEETSLSASGYNEKSNSDTPISIEFRSDSHAVIELPTVKDGVNYTQYILPSVLSSDEISDDIIPTAPNSVTDGGDMTSGIFFPWLEYSDEELIKYVMLDSSLSSPTFMCLSYDSEQQTASVTFSGSTANDVLFGYALNKVCQNLGKNTYMFIDCTDGYCYLLDVSGAICGISSDSINIVLYDAPVISRITAQVRPAKPTVPVLAYTANAKRVFLGFVSATVEFTGYRTLRIYEKSLLTRTNYSFFKYKYERENIEKPAGLRSDDAYLFIGEIYNDYSENDTRYGGTNPEAIENNRFIKAGPQYIIPSIASSGMTLYADQGDTFFQRYDSLRIKPFSEGSVNNVIDIASVMLETHLNIDGRTDNQRGLEHIASTDTETFGQINPVYTQPNNAFVARDLNDEFNTDAYRSSITWTLPKSDMESVDPWTHITLASSLKLDGDKGICRALRRFKNSIIAFQDTGIAEVMFNSKTQLSTTDGVPVEIANSGKVDGKRYMTNKYGCINKWSIVEGKDALYFVDNINKAFCAANFNQYGKLTVDNLSTKKFFASWFRSINSIKPWTPGTDEPPYSPESENIVSFYDRIHSDVYLVKFKENDDYGCLVYNEVLGTFTTFLDYSCVPMMANVDDRFLSFKNHRLWLQNEGYYCNFFDSQKDFWITYRVAPDSYTDKIWTNVDYKADFYKVMDENGKLIISETMLLDGNDYLGVEAEDFYQENETFTNIKVWNEYQTTKDDNNAVKKFRTWRYTIPRALANGKNKYGMDRIRNSWINLMLKKEMKSGDEMNLMQLHEVIAKYFV